MLRKLSYTSWLPSSFSRLLAKPQGSQNPRKRWGEAAECWEKEEKLHVLFRVVQRNTSGAWKSPRNAMPLRSSVERMTSWPATPPAPPFFQWEWETNRLTHFPVREQFWRASLPWHNTSGGAVRNPICACPVNKESTISPEPWPLNRWLQEAGEQGELRAGQSYLRASQAREQAVLGK